MINNVFVQASLLIFTVAITIWIIVDTIADKRRHKRYLNKIKGKPLSTKERLKRDAEFINNVIKHEESKK